MHRIFKLNKDPSSFLSTCSSFILHDLSVHIIENDISFCLKTTFLFSRCHGRGALYLFILTIREIAM